MTRPNVVISTGASNRDLCRLSDVKDELGLTGTGDDPKIRRLIAVAGKEFSQILDREPWRQVYTESRQGQGGLYLYLSRWPIESVSEITYNDSAVDSDTYSIRGDRKAVYREDGWQLSADEEPLPYTAVGGAALDYEISYTAGWLMPGQVTEWSEDKAYEVGDWVSASDASTIVRFECTTAGTSGSSEPTWDTDAAATTADNSAAWTTREATELPEDLEQGAIMRVLAAYRESLVDPMIASESFESMRITYRDAERRLTPGLVNLLRNYR